MSSVTAEHSPKVDLCRNIATMTSTMPSLPAATGIFQQGSAQSSEPATHQQTGRTDVPMLGIGSTKQKKLEQKSSAYVEQTQLEKPYTRGRQNSLRHVKNSKEVLRQRSANRGTKDIAPEVLSGGREGQQFTVANVGNNGRIYLR